MPIKAAGAPEQGGDNLIPMHLLIVCREQTRF